jgi:polysaccharide biosynthesis protein PslH
MEHILFLSNDTPFPPKGGGRIRDFSLIRVMAETMKVHVIAFSGSKEVPREIPSGQVSVSLVERDRRPIWERITYPFRPYFINGYSKNLEKELVRQAAPGRILWISRLVMAQYIPIAKKLGYKVVLDEHNIESNLLLNMATSTVKNWRHLPMALLSQRFEVRFCSLANRVVTTSDEDAKQLHSLLPHCNVSAIANTVDYDEFKTARERQGTTVFFPGTLNYAPNEEGLLWFVRDIFPLVKKSLGDKLPTFIVAGANPSPQFKSTLEKAGIQVIANPPSMTPLFLESRIVIVPLLSGSGTRLKILEAMASSRPVISTSKGAEGLALKPGENILIADSASEFAEKLVSLLNNPEACENMAQQSADWVLSHYDWRTLRSPMSQLIESLSSNT